MKANRKTMLIAAFAIAAIALAGGIGYALTGYNATTTVAGNTATTEFITITLDDDDNDDAELVSTTVYSGQKLALAYDSKTDATGTKYKLNGEAQEMIFNITVTGSENVPDSAVFRMDITLPNLSGNGLAFAWTSSIGTIEGTNVSITDLAIGDLSGDLTLTVSAATADQGWFTGPPQDSITLDGITITVTRTA